MADLVITEADVAVVKAIEQFTLPSDEAFGAGEVIRLATATGKATPGNGSSAGEARVLGIAAKAAEFAGDVVTIIKKGILDLGDALDALAYDDDVFLSDTDGTLADTAGTVSVVVGRVIPGWGATTADKLLLVDL